MRGKSQTGEYGEQLAKKFLESKGYQIVALNYRYKRLEIDIIAIIDETLIFVEVKTRSKTFFGNPEDAVDNKKIKNIVEAADEYIYEHDWNGDIRFDVIAVIAKKIPQIRHFKDAFY